MKKIMVIAATLFLLSTLNCFGAEIINSGTVDPDPESCRGIYLGDNLADDYFITNPYISIGVAIFATVLLIELLTERAGS